MLGRRSKGSRTWIVLFACAVAWVMGVRAPHAASFADIAFAGKGRATLKIDEVGAEDDASTETSADAHAFGTLDVFAKMTFGTEVSAFARGLYARSTFTLPRTGDTAVLVVDVDRGRSAKTWKAGDRGLRARLYTEPKGNAGARFDGAPTAGSLELEAAVIGRTEAGFRIRGWLEIVDPGADATIGTGDDTTLEVDVTLESIPSPEEISGQPAPPPAQPPGGVCVAPLCWADDDYYDGYQYGYGCGDAEVGYDTTDDGCSSSDSTTTTDTSGDGTLSDDGSTAAPGAGDVPDVTSSNDGCDSSSSSDSSGSSGSSGSGCSGSDDGSSSDGCNGGDSGSDSSSGCGSGSGDSGGCGGSGGGCSGDTLDATDHGGARAPSEGGGTTKAGVDLVGLGLFAAAIGTWISDRRERRGRRD